MMNKLVNYLFKDLKLLLDFKGFITKNIDVIKSLTNYALLKLNLRNIGLVNIKLELKTKFLKINLFYSVFLKVYMFIYKE